MKLLCDLDGLLVDFVTGALKVHNRSEVHDDIVTWNFYEEWGMDANEFWAPMACSEFWENLEPYPWTVEFFKELKKLGDVTLCTSPNSDPNCIVGKYRWGKKHLGVKVKDFMVGGKKHLMAKQGILIDDYVENVHKFREAGGTALLFKQPWNSSHISYGWEEILKILKESAHIGNNIILNNPMSNEDLAEYMKTLRFTTREYK